MVRGVHSSPTPLAWVRQHRIQDPGGGETQQAQCCSGWTFNFTPSCFSAWSAPSPSLWTGATWHPATWEEVSAAGGLSSRLTGAAEPSALGSIIRVNSYQAGAVLMTDTGLGALAEPGTWGFVWNRFWAGRGLIDPSSPLPVALRGPKWARAHPRCRKARM